MSNEENEGRSKRLTDGDTILAVQIKKKYVFVIMSLLATPGGIAAWKSFGAEKTAEQADKKANVAEVKAVNVQENADDRFEAGYMAIRIKLDATAQEVVRCRVDLERERLRIDGLWYSWIDRLSKKKPPPSPPPPPSAPAPATTKLQIPDAVTQPLPATVDKKENP